MWLEKLLEKTSKAAAEARKRALKSHQKPYSITMDNGGEFIGPEFQDVLAQSSIKQHRIHPHNPEENGKIERLWFTLECSIVDRNDLDGWVNEYNTCWPHSSLKKLDVRHRALTPSEAWSMWERLEGHQESELTIDYVTE
jgi:transposase InsO family protein